MHGDNSRVWDGHDVRVKRGKKSREYKFNNYGDADPLCECIDYCKDSDIFVYSVKLARGAQTHGRCKCWTMPKKVNDGTVRTKNKSKNRSSKYQLGAITENAIAAIKNVSSAVRLREGWRGQKGYPE